MRILVADDDALFHKMAEAVLQTDGFELMHAKDGPQALALFQQAWPELVLTDYQMPGMNGIELCRRIKALDPRRFIPMVMLTGEGETSLLRDSLEAGVVEFLTKPVHPDELRLRVRSLAELIALHTDLALAKSASDEELLITKHILHRLVEPSLRTMPDFIHMETLPTRRINGDACTYRQGLPGVHFGFLCDATGHGLAAGISTIPAIQAFLSMAARDLPLEIIYREVNTRLRQMLPTGRFVCLLLVRLDLHNATLSLLNAGLPDALLLTSDGTARRFASQNLPAGVLDQVEPPKIEEVAVEGGERLLAFTDGIQEVLGQEEAYRFLMEDLAECPFDRHRAAIQDLLRSGIRNREQQDDVSWALWHVPPPLSPRMACPFPKSEPAAGPLETAFAFELTFDPRLHPVREILPDCLRLLSGHGISSDAGQNLALALTEAVINAVDHGLLRLESDLKEQGFEAYEAARRERLAASGPGSVTLRIRLDGGDQRRAKAIRVEVEDSGYGFDWRRLGMVQESPNPRVSGRGLLIIQSLAPDVSFNEAGNCLRFTLPCE
ncbi:MAG TPA: fused response regulator/phosphatase [Geothrix sp.]|nr:fused response regulator/phosphatase [Geothrix sp.]